LVEVEAGSLGMPRMSLVFVASFKAVSVACRRPSHFSLLAQREVAKRNGLV
jgi:hypothetical protein